MITSDVKFSQLPASGTLTGSELVPLTQSGVSVATTLSAIHSYVGLGYTPVNAATVGVANGVAGLDINGKVPSSQLPVGVATLGVPINLIASSGSSTTTNAITIDGVLVSNGTTTLTLVNFNSVLNIAAIGLNGMDTNVPTANTYVAIYAIYNAITQVNGLLGSVVSSTAPLIYGGSGLPSGFTMSGLISVVYVDANGNIVPFTQKNNVIYTSPLSITTQQHSTLLSIIAATNITATNISGGVAGSLPYQTGVATTGMLPIGSNGNVLSVVSGVPAWVLPTTIYNPAAVAITGGSITGVTLNNTIIGGSVPAGANFTTANATTFIGALTGHASADLSLTGGTMTGALILASDPTTGLQASTKQYVDASLANAAWKSPVACATTTNITLSGEQTIDGITTSASRVLVKNQTTTSQNGLYISGAGAWVRSSDASTGAELVNMAVFSTTGTINAGTLWINSNNAITIETTSVTFIQFASGVAYTNGTGIGLSGAVFSNTGVLSITGTTNQISASTSTGAITLSLPQNINSGAAPTFVGTNFTGVPYTSLTGSPPTWNQNTTGNAATATNVNGGVTGSLIYQSATNTTAMLSIGTNGQYLTVVGGALAWQSPSTGTVSSITGTPNQIAASTATGAITLSLPSAISGIATITTTGAITGSNFIGAGTGLTGTASLLTVGTANALTTTNGYQIAKLGVGIVSSSWSSWNAIDMSTVGAVAGSTTQAIISNNSYYDGTNWRTKINAAGSLLALNSDGTIAAYTMASVAAGATQTLVQTISINATGALTTSGGFKTSGASAIQWTDSNALIYPTASANGVIGIRTGTGANNYYYNFDASGNFNVLNGNLTTTGSLSVGGVASTHAGSVVFNGSNAWGGTNYHGFMQVTNTYNSGTNKYFRLNPTGGLEIVNSAYSSVIFGMDDSGNLNTYTGSITTTNVTASGGVIYFPTGGYVQGNNSTYGMIYRPSAAGSNYNHLWTDQTGTGQMYLAAGGNLSLTGSISSKGVIGYGPPTSGIGGTVTQATSRSTGVTLSKLTGAITLFAAAPVVGTWVTFTVTNTTISTLDVVNVSVKSGTNTYVALVSAVAAGSFDISFQSISGTASDSPVINFVVMQGQVN